MDEKDVKDNDRALQEKRKSAAAEKEGLHYSEPSRWYRSVVPNRGYLCSPGNICQYLETFDVTTGWRRGGRLRMLLVSGGWKPGYVKLLTMYRMVPYNK